MNNERERYCKAIDATERGLIDDAAIGMITPSLIITVATFAILHGYAGVGLAWLFLILSCGNCLFVFLGAHKLMMIARERDYAAKIAAAYADNAIDDMKTHIEKQRGEIENPPSQQRGAIEGKEKE